MKKKGIITDDAAKVLGELWIRYRDEYKRTESVLTAGEVNEEFPGFLDRFYYNNLAGISLHGTTTVLIAYEKYSHNNRRYVLYADGRVDVLTDNQLRKLKQFVNPEDKKRFESNMEKMKEDSERAYQEAVKRHQKANRTGTEK